MPRVVSLIAASTEILHALGFGKYQVGRSHECDYPLSVQGLPICTSPKFVIEGSSADVDRQVKEVLQDALSVYHVDAAQLDSLSPDLIITQSQCEVCAVSLRDVEEAACQLIHSQPRIVSLQPNSLDDVWADIRKIATAMSAPERGERLIAKMKGRMSEIAKQAERVVEKPTVACIEWIDPLMAAGNWMPTLLEMAGGVNLFGTAGKHAPWMEWGDLVQADPDVIVVMACGYQIPKNREEMAALTRRPEWARLKAVQGGRVYVADGHNYFNRPGPRLVDTLEILAEILHPERFNFGHREKGWVPW